MHETILKAWKGIAGLKQPKYFKTWLIRILINESIRIRRQKNPECFVNPKLDSEDDIITFPEVASERPEWQPGQILEFEDMMRMLSMPVREVLVLYYGEGYTAAEIAELLSSCIFRKKRYVRDCRAAAEKSKRNTFEKKNEVVK